MTQSHTSGPWNHKGGRVCYGNSQDSDFKVAEVFGKNREADAAIISAAPELLAALQSMVEQFNMQTLPGIVHDERMAIIKAYEAIEKATGGAK